MELRNKRKIRYTRKDLSKNSHKLTITLTIPMISVLKPQENNTNLSNQSESSKQRQVSHTTSDENFGKPGQSQGANHTDVDELPQETQSPPKISLDARSIGVEGTNTMTQRKFYAMAGKTKFSFEGLINTSVFKNNKKATIKIFSSEFFIRCNFIYNQCALTYGWKQTCLNETVAKSVCKLLEHPSETETETGVGSTAASPNHSLIRSRKDHETAAPNLLPTNMEEGGLDLPNIVGPGLGKQSRILKIEKMNPNTNPINILVQLLSGQTRNIILEDSKINVETLTEQISQETRIPIKDLRVIYQSKEIYCRSKAQISELNILNGSILDIRLRIKGGMDKEDQKSDIEKTQMEKLNRLHNDLNDANIYTTGSRAERFNVREKFRDISNDTIYRSLEYIFQNDEIDLIDPAQSSINNIFNEDNNVIQDTIQDMNANILEFKKKAFKCTDEEMRKYETVISKPIVYIMATQYKDRNLNVNQKNTQRISDYGSHWVCLLITPRNYGGLLKHNPNPPGPERVFLFDSINSQRSIPTRIKEGLTSKWNKMCVDKLGDTEIQYTTEYPSSLAEDAQFENKAFLTQQYENSCGYWAMYNAVMLLLTGDASFYDNMHKTSAKKNVLNHLAEAHIREVFEAYIPFLRDDMIDEEVRSQTDLYQSNNFKIPEELKLKKDGSLDLRTKAARDYVSKLKEEGRINELQNLSTCKTMDETPEKRTRSISKNAEKQNNTNLRGRDQYPLKGKRAQDRDTSASPIGPSPIKRNKSELNTNRRLKQPNILNFLNKSIDNKEENKSHDGNKIKVNVNRQSTRESKVYEEPERHETLSGEEKYSNIEQNQNPLERQEVDKEEEDITRREIQLYSK